MSKETKPLIPFKETRVSLCITGANTLSFGDTATNVVVAHLLKGADISATAVAGIAGITEQIINAAGDVAFSDLTKDQVDAAVTELSQTNRWVMPLFLAALPPLKPTTSRLLSQYDIDWLVASVLGKAQAFILEGRNPSYQKHPAFGSMLFASAMLIKLMRSLSKEIAASKGATPDVCVMLNAIADMLEDRHFSVTMTPFTPFSSTLDIDQLIAHGVLSSSVEDILKVIDVSRTSAHFDSSNSVLASLSGIEPIPANASGFTISEYLMGYYLQAGYAGAHTDFISHAIYALLGKPSEGDAPRKPTLKRRKPRASSNKHLPEEKD